ncbi:MAG: hypothetical protein WCA32_07890 [Chromatiaceae bacterium]
MTAPRIILAVLLVSNLTLAAAADEVPQGARETAGEDPDWPCEQALVPEISAAVVWDGPSVEGLKQSWQNVSAVAALVKQISSPKFSEEGAKAAVASFAAEQKPEDKNRMLTLVFAGVLEQLNDDRDMLIEGVKRYSRDQARRADALGDELDQMVRLEQDPSPGAAQQLAELRKRLELEQRVFDDREKSINYLCLRPVAVEQRLGFLARTIAEYLD